MPAHAAAEKVPYACLSFTAGFIIHYSMCVNQLELKAAFPEAIVALMASRES